MKPQVLCIVGLMLLTGAQVSAQYGNRDYRGRNYMNGGEIRTVFYNTGLIGNIGEISFAWPQGTANEYMGDFTPMLGAKFVHPSGDTLVSVTTSDGPRGNPDGPPGGGAFWGFEPMPGFRAEPPLSDDMGVARSDLPESWPTSWQGMWLGNPAVQMIGTQEAYFQVDDNADLEWRVRNEQVLYPFPDDTSRGGLGLRMEVRYAVVDVSDLEDCLLMIYVISNDGVVEFEEMAFGFMVGTLSGGRQDSEDDLMGYVEEHGLAVWYDSDDRGSPGWVPVSDSVNVGYAGVKFIKTPNDLGITMLQEISPPGAIRMRDDNALWQRMSSGQFDIYDEPEDGDFIVATSGFQIAPGESDTIIAALVAGADYDDLILKAETIQAFYDGGFNDADDRPELPRATSLRPNYPNPFNPATEIEYSLAQPGNVKLAVYDLLGREVRVLTSGMQNAGDHAVRFDGAGLPSGVYIYRLQAGDYLQSRKMVLLK